MDTKGVPTHRTTHGTFFVWLSLPSPCFPWHASEAACPASSPHSSSPPWFQHAMKQLQRTGAPRGARWESPPLYTYPRISMTVPRPGPPKGYNCSDEGRKIENGRGRTRQYRSVVRRAGGCGFAVGLRLEKVEVQSGAGIPCSTTGILCSTGDISRHSSNR